MSKSTQVRISLLQNASELFDSKGYNATSVKDISDKMGWPKSLFYYYFASKEQLLDAVSETRAQFLGSTIMAALEQCDGVFERMQKVLDYCGFWAGGDTRTAAKCLGKLYGELNQPWRALLRERLSPILAALCNDVVAHGVKQYEMYSPFPQNMGPIIVNLAMDLSDQLAREICAGDDELGRRITQTLNAYRMTIERLIEAPFNTVRIVEAEFVMNAAQALKDLRAGDIELRTVEKIE